MTQSKSFYLIAAQNRGGTVFNTANVAAQTVMPLNAANGRNGVEKSPPHTIKAGVHYDASNSSCFNAPGNRLTLNVNHRPYGRPSLRGQSPKQSIFLSLTIKQSINN